VGRGAERLSVDGFPELVGWNGRYHRDTVRVLTKAAKVDELACVSVGSDLYAHEWSSSRRLSPPGQGLPADLVLTTTSFNAASKEAATVKSMPVPGGVEGGTDDLAVKDRETRKHLLSVALMSAKRRKQF